MSVFWVAFGFSLGLSKNIKVSIQGRQQALFGVAFVFFLSGLARLISVIQTGFPIPLFAGAMILEFVIPIIMMILLLKQK